MRSFFKSDRIPRILSLNPSNRPKSRARPRPFPKKILPFKSLYQEIGKTIVKSVLGGGTKTLAGAIVYIKRTKVNQCSSYLRSEHRTTPSVNKSLFRGKFCGAFSKATASPRPPTASPASLAQKKQNPRLKQPWVDGMGYEFADTGSAASALMFCISAEFSATRFTLLGSRKVGTTR